MKTNNEKPQQDINVIVLKNRAHYCKQEIIDSYIEILKGCRTVDEFQSLFDMFYDEVSLTVGELFVEKQIQKNAEILEEMRNEFF